MKPATPEKRVTDIVRGLAKEVRRDQMILDEVAQNVFTNTRELRNRIKESVRRLELLGQRKFNINMMLDRILHGLTDDIEEVNRVLNEFNNSTYLMAAVDSLPYDFRQRYRLTEMINQLRTQVEQQERMTSRMAWGGAWDNDSYQTNIDSMIKGTIGPRLQMIRDGLTKRNEELGKIIAGIRDSTKNTHSTVEELIKLINQLLPENAMNESRNKLNQMRSNLFKQMSQLRQFYGKSQMLESNNNAMMFF